MNRTYIVSWFGMCGWFGEPGDAEKEVVVLVGIFLCTKSIALLCEYGVFDGLSGFRSLFIAVPCQMWHTNRTDIVQRRAQRRRYLKEIVFISFGKEAIICVWMLLLLSKGPAIFYTS